MAPEIDPAPRFGPDPLGVRNVVETTMKTTAIDVTLDDSRSIMRNSDKAVMLIRENGNMATIGDTMIEMEIRQRGTDTADRVKSPLPTTQIGCPAIEAAHPHGGAEETIIRTTIIDGMSDGLPSAKHQLRLPMEPRQVEGRDRIGIQGVVVRKAYLTEAMLLQLTQLLPTPLQARDLVGRKPTGDTLSNGDSVSTGPSALTVGSEDQELTTDLSPVDEATLIEERRKRREAIKAKYKNQSAKPLLVQALEHSGEVTTPEAYDPTRSVTVSESVTPLLSPNSPQAVDSPGSQADSFDEGNAPKLERAEPRLAIPGVSAADYDPTADQKADLARDEHQHHVHDESRTAKSVAELPPVEDPATASISSPTGPKVPDMFSESFEDDIQVEDSNKPIVRQDLDAGLAREQDDSEGFFRPIIHEIVNERYQIIENLGSGVFANVVRAKDIPTSKIVVLKIIRNNDEIKKGGLKEISVVKTLNEADPEDRKHILRFVDSFEHKYHLWLVYENMDMDFRQLLKKIGNNSGLHITGVRQFARQVFLALSHLKKCNIIHADIKPDNILVDHAHKNIKLADFGTSMEKEEAEITSYLASRYYRAPEVVLGLPFDFAIDMWAAGCTLFELYTGKILFDGRTNNNQLLKFMECRGKFPKWMVRDGRFGNDHFEHDHITFIALQQDRTTQQYYEKRMAISKPEIDLATRVKMAVPIPPGEDARLHRNFMDLLDQCLKLDPTQRINPHDALKHPFFMRHG
ncbi:kinase-like protein [Eremomyces bilateralis CBS 781.70]|uniref:non-specific serine/threonine protein kinase n=1 Tax=Eremomyces bilateralis CBS 781.70 TaxID=1392243 RepID=A0A6G1G528_9PEZI|nr:kinase-like protein [Eremomyces bilateralis CBS 781.70]KAF1813041.1 kinase-like protein [Eremomyces bilateralis CBS 781.70]